MIRMPAGGDFPMQGAEGKDNPDGHIQNTEEKADNE